MISLWPHWQRPFFLFLLPVLIYVLWKFWHLHQIRGSWQKLIPALFQPWLLKGTSAHESITPKLIITLASLLALLALLGPSWKHIEQPPLKIDAPLTIILDLTPKMLANDIPPNRLQSAKRKILDIIKNRKDAQTAIVVYSGSTHTLVPLSDDQSTISNLLDSISPSIMPVIGDRADLGIEKALQLLTNTQQQNAQLLLITTGLSDQEQTAIKQLIKKDRIPLNILGVGTAQGAPILLPTGNFLKDNNGNIILPKLDAKSLQSLAYSEGGLYSTITLNNDDIQALNLTKIKGGQRHIEDNEKKASTLWQDQGYWLLLPLLLCAALSARKGWLFCIPLLFMLPPQPAHAFEWRQLWLNQDQQGQQLLKENKPIEAAKRFKDKQWQGYSNYQANNYLQAAQAFAKGTSPETIYNYGNTLARQGKYQEAITQWDNAIKAKPNFEQAIKNKKIVEDFLKKQQNQQQNDKNNQNKNKPSDEQKDSEQQDETQQNQDTNQQQVNQPQKEPQQPDNQQQKADNNNQAKDNASSENQKEDQKEKQSQKEHNEHKSQQAKQHDQQQNIDKATKDTQQQTLEQTNKQEQNESLQQWLRTIPDDPSELLRRKFEYEQRYNRGDN